MEAIEILYKPILPAQMRHFWESTQTFQLADFAGQKTSYFFTSQHYARHLASTYANELDALCYVMAFQFDSLFCQYISFERAIDDDCLVFGVPVEKLELCFPNIRYVTRIVDVCTPPVERVAVQYQLFGANTGR